MNKDAVSRVSPMLAAQEKEQHDGMQRASLNPEHVRPSDHDSQRPTAATSDPQEGSPHPRRGRARSATACCLRMVFKAYNRPSILPRARTTSPQRPWPSTLPSTSERRQAQALHLAVSGVSAL